MCLDTSVVFLRHEVKYAFEKQLRFIFFLSAFALGSIKMKNTLCSVHIQFDRPNVSFWPVLLGLLHERNPTTDY